MLMGEFEHALDSKGRLFVPAKMRESLGTPFVVTKGVDGCLDVGKTEKQLCTENDAQAENAGRVPVHFRRRL